MEQARSGLFALDDGNGVSWCLYGLGRGVHCAAVVDVDGLGTLIALKTEKLVFTVELAALHSRSFALLDAGSEIAIGHLLDGPIVSTLHGDFVGSMLWVRR